MSAESPRHARAGGGPLIVPSQPPSDRSIIDAVSGFINDVTLSSSSNVDPKDVIQWARFETADINEPTPEGDSDNDNSPLLLILGYGSGVQVWLIPPNGEAQEVLSWRQGTVRVLRILPTPQHGDHFASKRPLIALCDSASPGPAFCSLSFISIRGGEQVKSIKFKNQILDVLANKRTVVVSFSERFAVFDAATLEDRMAVTTCFPCPCPLGGSMPVNPLALGDRWLAYADKKLNQSKRSSGGCEGEGVSSYTATVLHAAKSLSKGLRGLGETVAHSLSGGRSTSQSPSPPNADIQQPGVITIIDIEGNDEEEGQDSEEPCDPIIAHFVAHSEAIMALKFDASGMLLVTADRRGHDFHVFRINPHPCGPSLASVHHLYILHRGDTTAKVQDIAISPDSRWTAISTLRGTTHVFAISPYGGACGVRTHTQPRVVNRLSRFHRSAGLPIHTQPPRRSPVGDGMSSGAWFPNPRLPPYPQPATSSPLAQLRPTNNLPTHTITRTSSGRQRLSSLSEDSSSAPLLARARFGLCAYGGSGGSGGGGGSGGSRPAVASLYLLPADGTLLHLALQPRPLAGVPKEKICDDSPIELHVEGVAQWTLQRPPAAADLLAPLPPANPLLRTRHVSKCADICMSEEERWLSQVEIVTHAGPHRRLWMGPQFVFKTYNCTGSNSSLSEAETVEVEPGVARSNPVNMPGVRPLVPVFIDSGSPSSLEHSPSDSFRRRSLLSEGGRAASLSDVQLREDLAEAMKEDHGWSPAPEPGAEERRGGVTRAVGPRGCVVASPAPAHPPPPAPGQRAPDADADTSANCDEARFRPVVRAPAALPPTPAPLLRPLPRTTTIPVQPLTLPSAHRSERPTDRNEMQERSLNVMYDDDSAREPTLRSEMSAPPFSLSDRLDETTLNPCSSSRTEEKKVPGAAVVSSIGPLRSETYRDGELGGSDKVQNACPEPAVEHVLEVQIEKSQIKTYDRDEKQKRVKSESSSELNVSSVEISKSDTSLMFNKEKVVDSFEEKSQSSTKTLPLKQRSAKRDRNNDKETRNEIITKEVSPAFVVEKLDRSIKEKSPSTKKHIEDKKSVERSVKHLSKRPIESVKHENCKETKILSGSNYDSTESVVLSNRKDSSNTYNKEDSSSVECEITLQNLLGSVKHEIMSEEKVEISSIYVPNQLKVENTETAKESSPKEIAKESSPKEIAKESSPKDTAKENSPKEIAKGSSLKETVKEKSPKRTVREISPKETVKETSPKGTVRESSPKETVRESSPKETVHKLEKYDNVTHLSKHKFEKAAKRDKFEKVSKHDKFEKVSKHDKFEKVSKHDKFEKTEDCDSRGFQTENIDESINPIEKIESNLEGPSIVKPTTEVETQCYSKVDKLMTNEPTSDLKYQHEVLKEKSPLLPVTKRRLKSVWGNEDIRTEDQAWDMLLNEAEKPQSANVPLIVDEPKPKSKKNRRVKKAIENQTQADEDSFVEIHAIEDKHQTSCGDLVSISSPFEDVDTCNSFLTKTKKIRSTKSLTPDRSRESNQNVMNFSQKEQFGMNCKIDCREPNVTTVINTPSKSNDDVKLRTKSNTLIITQSFEADIENYKGNSESIKPRKAKSLSPYVDYCKPVESIDNEVKDVYVIDSTKDEFPEIQITRGKPRKKSPQASELISEEKSISAEIPIKSWSSIAATKSGRKNILENLVFSEKKENKTENEAENLEALDETQVFSPIPRASTEEYESSTTISLHEKLYELCKRRDIMVAECDAPSELNFVEEHHSVLHDLPPLEPLDFGLDDFKLEVMRDSLIELNDPKITSPICKINIDDILSTIKDTTSKVIESSTYNLIDLEKLPVKKEKGFSVISSHKITSQEIKIDDEVRSNDGDAEMMEKSSDDDNTSPVISTDSDKEDKKLGALKLLLPSSSKQTAKAKKSRRKKK